ncbi:protein JINGUBANG-like [Neltuma alba]|uniref:protein JINGUBANG-like n=1 Tax=Neltuma alba TaxID=207710 RepID=UPI0010A2AFDA|nr:protein JINGUBANG-like [Prosopis alba]
MFSWMKSEQGGAMVADPSGFHRPRFGALLHSDRTSFCSSNYDGEDSTSSPMNYADSTTTSNASSPYLMSPWNPVASPYNKSPWLLSSPIHDNTYGDGNDGHQQNSLIKSLVREEGNIYSLAVSADFLYTGTDSKNIRVWKNLRSHGGFKSSSGLVKAIVISGDKIFTGHQDGKIRVWKSSQKFSGYHKRIGTLPTFKDYVKNSTNPKNYVKIRRHKKTLRIKHFDAISSMTLDENQEFLYSCSWDKTLKVWRLSDFKCLESIQAHDDAVNSVVAGFQCFVFTGSADGTVKMWRRETTWEGKTRHVLDRILLKQDNAVTALAVNSWSTVLYCGSSDGVVNLWERFPKNNLRHGGMLRGHKLAVLCLAAGKNLVFSGSADKNVCVWKREVNGSHTCLSVLTGHTGPVKCIAAEQDQEQEEIYKQHRWTVYTGSLDKSVKVWRVYSRSGDTRRGK